MIIVGGLFSYYKLFYRRIFKIIFTLIKYLIILLCAKNIEEILKSEKGKNFRSILFFYTNILIEPDRKDKRNFPVKRFQVKGYIGLIHYIGAVGVIFKIFLYMSIYYFIKYMQYGFGRDLLLVLREHGNLRIPVYIGVVYQVETLVFGYFYIYKTLNLLYRDRLMLTRKFYKRVRIIRFIKGYNIKTTKIGFLATDKIYSGLGGR